MSNYKISVVATQPQMALLAELVVYPITSFSLGHEFWKWLNTFSFNTPLILSLFLPNPLISFSLALGMT